jgi:acyl CoA:acetate/3-ketoacid CoA transferase alpha subunit
MAKFQDLKTAVAENLHDGDVVAFEGFTHLIPHAAAHEAIRQGRKDLTLVRMTPDVIYDQMIGMGMAKKLAFCAGCAMRSKTAGRTGRKWKNTAMRRWPMLMRRAQAACHAPSSADTSAPGSNR